MDREGIIAELDRNIADLTAARTLLTKVEGLQTEKLHLVKKRTISAEGRERMKAAQQKRWRKAKRLRSAKPIAVANAIAAGYKKAHA